MSNELPIDVRIRELWKAVAITASEHDSSSMAVNKADDITLSFIERFYPNDMMANEQRVKIKRAS